MHEEAIDKLDDDARNKLHDALARTALLLRLDAFPRLTPGDDAAIIDALRTVGIRIVADNENLASPNGQTTLVTLVCQCAMLGMRIDLEAPDVPQLVPQPPLSAELPVVSALIAWANDLFPGCLSLVESPVVTFAIGDTRTPQAESPVVQVSGGDYSVLLTSDRSATHPWRGMQPWGPIAAAASAAAEAMRAAIPMLAALLGQPTPVEVTWRPRPFSGVRVDLPRTVIAVEPRGDIDIVSAGAITQATLYTLLRVPDFAANIRVIDRDVLGRSNSNRYPLIRAADLDRLKVEHLADLSNGSIRIRGAGLRFDTDTIGDLEPLASRIIVGVDDIPTRWFVQAQQPEWLGVGATSHAFVVVSDHLRGRPCAGCVHPRDDEDLGEEIPTIGFVSLWAGLLLAMTTLAPTDSDGDETWRMEAHPMGIDGADGILRLPQSRNPRCPVCGT